MQNKVYSKNNKLNDGNRNLGFELNETIKEQVDNSHDANGKRININIFETDYEVFTLNNESKKIVAKRYVIAVIDDGKSSEKETLGNIFEFGLTDKRNIISNKNGRFH